MSNKSGDEFIDTTKEIGCEFKRASDGFIEASLLVWFDSAHSMDREHERISPLARTALLRVRRKSWTSKALKHLDGLKHKFNEEMKFGNKEWPENFFDLSRCNFHMLAAEELRKFEMRQK